jgi:nucleoside-diphosphate-sugar epimerase
MTGGSGFLGSNLSSEIEKIGVPIFHVPSLKEFTSASSISDLEIQIMQNSVVSEIIDKLNSSLDLVVIHCANRYVKHSYEEFSELGSMKFSILDLLYNILGISMTKFKSIYVVNFESYLQNEDSTFQKSASLYAALKNANSTILRHLHQSNNIQLLNIMLYDTFGFNDKRSKLIPQLLNLSIQDKKELIIANPKNLINILEIQTLCRTLIDFIFAKRVGNYTFMRNQNFSVQEVVNLCEVSWNVKFNLTVAPYEKNRDKEIASIWLNRNNENIVVKSPDISYELSQLWKRFSSESELM